MYTVLNTLSEYTYFYISKNITSDTFLLALKIIDSVSLWHVFFFFFLIETSVISFCRISNLSFYLNKKELRKNCQENWEVKGMTPDICFFVFAHICHICQNFGTRT